MKEPVLIIGATGLVGGALARALARRGAAWSGTSRSDRSMLLCDVREPQSVQRTVEQSAPGAVVLTAALTNVDYCESHEDEARAINTAGVETAAKAAAAANAKFVYISTDYVFDGGNGPYLEDDPPCPVSVYGASKLDGERAAMHACPDALIIRTTVVYAWDPNSKNFLMQLNARLNGGETMNVPVDQWSTPAEANDLAECILELLDRNAAGVFNVTGPDYVSRHTLAMRAASVLGHDPALIRPLATADLGQAAPRPRYAGLLLRKFRDLTGREPLGIEAGLEKFLQDKKNAQKQT